MRLVKLAYSEFDGAPRYWRLHPADFQQINLIVGLNSSGKSRTLNVINGLAQSLTGGRSIPSVGDFDVSFEDGTSTWRYRLLIENSTVTEEELTKDGNTLLWRKSDGKGEMLFTELGTTLAFQAEQNVIAASTRVDRIQHPYLLPLLNWAGSVFHYRITDKLGKSNVTMLAEGGAPLNPKDPLQTTGVLKAGLEQFGDSFKAEILKDMFRIGYNLIDLMVSPPITITVQGGQASVISVIEWGVESPIDQFSLSEGMFGALAIIIHLNYGLFSQEPRCVLIDDIGEGLDFDRSSKLINLLVSKITQTQTQLIMTTNDRYVMNAIDLEYWTVLSRKGPEVKAYNKKNRPTEFEEFTFTGLNNFDFLARDYLETE